MRSIYDFNVLTENEKYDLTFTKAQFVDTATAAETKYALYSLSNFWIEVEYHSPTNKIKGICSFVSGEKLNRYSNVPKEL